MTYSDMDENGIRGFSRTLIILRDKVDEHCEFSTIIFISNKDSMIINKQSLNEVKQNMRNY